MAIVPTLPTAGVSQKPDKPKPTPKSGMVIGFLFNEGSGLPKDIMGKLIPSSPAPDGGWAQPPIPWGGGYRITQGPITLGVENILPPRTIHVLFKLAYLPDGTPARDALIFGEVDPQELPVSGVGIRFGSATATAQAFGIYNGHTSYSFTPIEPQDHEWIAVTYTHDGTTATIYINGVPTKDSALIPDAPAGGRNWVIGGPNFSGVIADARVYSRALSDGEVATITSGYSMWNDYAGIEPNRNRQWRRHTFVLPGGAIRTSRRYAKIARR
jgi:Concanavalin A-like lectin/glucanases superfamily